MKNKIKIEEKTGGLLCVLYSCMAMIVKKHFIAETNNLKYWDTY